MTPDPPPQQPNRPEGLREILKPLEDHINSWIESELRGTSYYTDAVHDLETDMQSVKAAIRTRIERAIPPTIDIAERKNMYKLMDTEEDNKGLKQEWYDRGQNDTVSNFKSNIQRELGI